MAEHFSFCTSCSSSVSVSYRAELIGRASHCPLPTYTALYPDSNPDKTTFPFGFLSLKNLLSWFVDFFDKNYNYFHIALYSFRLTTSGCMYSVSQVPMPSWALKNPDSFLGLYFGRCGSLSLVTACSKIEIRLTKRKSSHWKGKLQMSCFKLHQDAARAMKDFLQNWVDSAGGGWLWLKFPEFMYEILKE